MANQILTVPVKERPKSQFSIPHHTRFTSRMGDIFPVRTINYHPGDSFKFNQSVGFNFPPLIAPAYQRIQQRLYNFRVPKHLTWSSEKLGKYLLSTVDGSAAPSQPSITCDSQFLYGASKFGSICNFNLPVYGFVENGKVYLQKDHLPSFLTLNDLIFGTSISDETMSLYLQSINYDTFANPQIRYLDPNGGFYKHTVYNFRYTSSNHEMHVHKTGSTEITRNYTKFGEIDTLDDGCLDRFIAPPLSYPNSLFEALGYPVDPIYFEDVHDSLDSKPIDLLPDGTRIDFDNHKIYDLCMYYISQRQFNGVIPVCNCELKFSQSLDYGALASIPSEKTCASYTTTLKDLLLVYAQYMITHGHGDGTLMTEEDKKIAPFINCIRLCDFMRTPSNDFDSSNPQYRLDLGRYFAYMLVIDNYFRDPSLSYKIDFSARNSSEFAFYDFVQANIHTSPLGEIIAYDGVNVAKYFLGDYSMGDYGGNQLGLMMHYLASFARKIRDRNYITSSLPTTTNIEVYAPTLSNDMVQSLKELNQDMSRYHDVDAVYPNQVSSNFNEVQSKPSYAPNKIINNPDDNRSFISVDAFRTAEIMQNFFRTAMLVGDRPVAFIILNFGVHSKDFRHEVPQLLSYQEDDCFIREIVQSAESQDSLPLGTEGGKLTSASLGKDSFIDDEGDYGYIVTLSIVVPEQDFVGGLDNEILAQDPWSQLFLPDFAELGEEELHDYEVLFRGHADAQSRTLGFRFGYTPRYQRFRFVQNRNLGRFNLDLKHWHSDIYTGYDSKAPVLCQESLYVRPDTRMFALPDQYNCIGLYVNKASVLREIPDTFYNIIG